LGGGGLAGGAALTASASGVSWVTVGTGVVGTLGAGRGGGVAFGFLVTKTAISSCLGLGGAGRSEKKMRITK
jgi:hypothetical protein